MHLLLAILLPILFVLTIIAALLLYCFLKRRAARSRCARELEHRAQWLDPEYIERVRLEMLDLDPNKVQLRPGERGGYGYGSATGYGYGFDYPQRPAAAATQTQTQLQTPGQTTTRTASVRATLGKKWSADTGTVAIDMHAVRHAIGRDPKDPSWLDRGKMSGAVVPRDPLDEGERGAARLHRARKVRLGSTATSVTRVTADGSPVLLGKSSQPSVKSLYSCEDDAAGARGAKPTAPGSGSNLHMRSPPPSEAEWMSSSSLRRLADTNTTTNVMGRPPPAFDPQGSLRASQIGLAVPFPKTSFAPVAPAGMSVRNVSRDSVVSKIIEQYAQSEQEKYKEGALTGDGYEELWKIDWAARRARAEDHSRRLSRIESEVAAWRKEGDVGGMVTTWGKTRGRFGMGSEATVGGTVEGSVASRTELLAGMRSKDDAEASGGKATAGNEEVVRGMLKDRLSAVKGFFG
jgi:hypothetical protein